MADRRSARAFEEGSICGVTAASNSRTLWPPPIPVQLILAVLFHFYLVASIARTWHRPSSWCEGVRFLTALTVSAYVFYGLSSVILWQSRRRIRSINVTPRRISPFSKLQLGLTVEGAVLVAFMTIACVFLLMDAYDSPLRLQSMGGLPFIVFVGYMFSANRSEIPWTQVLSCMSLQYLWGFLALRWNLGHDVLRCTANKINQFLEFSREGCEFAFGYLATGINMSDYVADTGASIEDIRPAFIFKSISVMFYITFIVNILYHYAVMQAAIVRVAVLLRVFTGTTVCESVSAVANVFLGMIEAPLLVRPYLPTLTKSELHCVMAGGFATIAGTVLAAYISFGISTLHLLTASFISAPGALAYSKVLYPETNQPRIFYDDFSAHKGREQTVLEAASRAAVVTLTIMGGIVANVVAFLASLAFVNMVLVWLLTNVGAPAVTFEDILGYVFTPFAALLGVPWVDCPAVGRLIGIKIFANEFIAYLRLAKIKTTLQKRSLVIATYALCGFGNLGSIGTMLGGLGALCPSRMEDITELVVRSMWAGVASSFMTACVAGSLVD